MDILLGSSDRPKGAAQFFATLVVRSNCLGNYARTSKLSRSRVSSANRDRRCYMAERVEGRHATPSLLLSWGAEPPAPPDASTPARRPITGCGRNLSDVLTWTWVWSRGLPAWPPLWLGRQRQRASGAVELLTSTGVWQNVPPVGKRAPRPWRTSARLRS